MLPRSELIQTDQISASKTTLRFEIFANCLFARNLLSMIFDL